MRTQHVGVAPYLDTLNYRRLEREEVNALFAKIRCGEMVARLSKEKIAGLIIHLRSADRKLSAEEQELHLQLKRGSRDFRANVIRSGERAREALIHAHLALVPHLISGWLKRARDPEALVQEGNIGLLHATRKFDPRRGILFSTYAGYWIRAYVQRSWHDGESVVRKGRSSHGGHVKTDGPDASLDAPLTSQDGPGQSRLDFVADEASHPEERLAGAERDAEIRAVIRSMKAGLRPMSRDLIWNRLGSDSPDTLDKIGQRHSVSRERVRQVEITTKMALRSALARFEQNENLHGMTGS